MMAGMFGRIMTLSFCNVLLLAISAQSFSRPTGKDNIETLLGGVRRLKERIQRLMKENDAMLKASEQVGTKNFGLDKNIFDISTINRRERRASRVQLPQAAKHNFDNSDPNWWKNFYADFDPFKNPWTKKDEASPEIDGGGFVPSLEDELPEDILDAADAAETRRFANQRIVQNAPVIDGNWEKEAGKWRWHHKATHENEILQSSKWMEPSNIYLPKSSNILQPNFHASSSSGQLATNTLPSNFWSKWRQINSNKNVFNDASHNSNNHNSYNHNRLNSIISNNNNNIPHNGNSYPNNGISNRVDNLHRGLSNSGTNHLEDLSSYAAHSHSSHDISSSASSIAHNRKSPGYHAKTEVKSHHDQGGSHGLNSHNNINTNLQNKNRILDLSKNEGAWWNNANWWQNWRAGTQPASVHAPAPGSLSQNLENPRMPERPTFRGGGKEGGIGAGVGKGFGAQEGVVTKEMIMKNVGNLPKWWNHPAFDKNN